MSNIDFSPLFRSMIGFDRLSSALENAYRSEPGGYPPYNVEVSGESDYRITMAVAGFSPGELALEVKENILGLAEVREVFRSSRLGAIAGCLVVEGVVRRKNPIRVLRGNVVIFEGVLESLRRFKDEVNEVQSGTECGIGVKQYNDVQPGDQIECFERIEVARTL